ncbi:unnamed protein product [Kuraishia capsulata CBS 1993]|uniref:Zn(2)-C6 fungal-type domain-containing protein n=1 Tax=Kuraishia capsulata CBS 1993 TaxID=1382522 RepID=W6MI59_9ASCO|nr:uncharacterized protein KUCA_T00002070001 [Kuraishia capsulata CBS 1993]CDK26099.1 unnamed protein product [Kuraishia capsulata CBS 1993]
MSQQNEATATPKQRRKKACSKCHALKMRCIYDNSKSPVECERCLATGQECNFMRSTLESEILEQILLKVEALEDSVTQFASSAPIELEGSKTGSSPKVLEEQNSVISHNRQDYLKSLLWTERTIDPLDTLPGAISQLLSHLQINTAALDQQFEERQAEDLRWSVSDLDEASSAKLLTFFRLHLARYLPVLIFNYVPRITEEMKEESPFLYYTILAVSSMNHQSYQHFHYSLREAVKQYLENIVPDSLFLPSGVPIDFLSLINEILACSVGAAWLCGDLGYKMSLIASDLVGRLTPNVLKSLKISSDQKNIVYFFSVMTFIMEQRYRITHYKVQDFAPNTEMIHQRDLYVSQYLQSIHSNRRDTRISRGALKADANVELCAVIMDLQKKIENTKTPNQFLEYSHELDMWLSDWICKLACSLTSTSLKPLIAAFQFVKLHLNSHAAFVSMSHAIPGIESQHFLSKSESIALDTLEMIKYDSDIKRLICFGPGFFATIFLTAIAVLAKTVLFASQLNYQCDVNRLMTTIVECHQIMLELIPYTNFAGSISVHRLGLCVEKLKKQVENSPPNPPANTSVDQAHTAFKSQFGYEDHRGSNKALPKELLTFSEAFDRRSPSAFDTFNYQSLWSKNLDDYDL